jgi:hypothetical protein
VSRAFVCGLLLPALVALLVVACGGRSDAPIIRPDDAGASSSDAPEADAAEALPPGVAYIQQGIKCCEKGIDRACCGGEDNCAPYGGFGDCAHAGSGISGKVACSICCPGLVTISKTKLVDGKCVDDKFLDSSFCAPCGDGVCQTSVGENPCNCPKDCPPS